ncbi:MAG: hypothetical protein ACK5C8_13155 [Roseiflexaceae bacterium]|jgi:hypothetical protein|nr:hypothetical protein [Chloroflexaceae bacterium]
MTYDAMRVLMRVALIKRALFDIYVETCDAQHATRKNLLSNIHFSEIMTDTAHAYDVVARLYAKLDDWREVHMTQMHMPSSDATLDMATIAAFVSRISTQVDIEALAHGGFPGTGNVGDCQWACTPQAGRLDERTWELDAAVASDGNESDADERVEPPSQDDYLDVDLDADDDSDDYDYPYYNSAAGMSDADAFDVFMGWNISSHHQHGTHERNDFACGDLSPALRDACHHELTNQEYQLLFGLQPPPPPGYKIDIFGNPIIEPQTSDDDSPDYNVPGAPLP